jgi:hypothetical protein
VLGRAVVGVQRDGDRVAGGELPTQGGEGERAGEPVVECTREVARSADGDLHDAVRSGLREPPYRRIQGLRRRDVHGRERITPGRRPVQHRRILLRGRQHVRIIPMPGEVCPGAAKWTA